MGQKIIGVGFLLLGIGICLMDPLITLKCTRAEGPEANCVLSVRALGVIPLARMECQDVTGVTVSSRTWYESEGAQVTEDIEQLILRSKSGDVRSKWLGRRSAATGAMNHVIVSLPSFNSFVSDMNNLIESGKNGESAEYKAITWMPLCVGLGFMLFGVLALWPFLFPARKSGRG